MTKYGQEYLMTKALQYREVYGQVTTRINYCSNQEEDSHSRVAVSLQIEHLFGIHYSILTPYQTTDYATNHGRLGYLTRVNQAIN